MVPVDGLAIARRSGLGRVVNSALLGGFARALGTLPLEAMETTLGENSPKLHDENIAACGEGWHAVDALLQGAMP